MAMVLRTGYDDIDQREDHADKRANGDEDWKGTSPTTVMSRAIAAGGEGSDGRCRGGPVRRAHISKEGI